MKILHLCLGCFYIDNYSYQENIIPKYHKELGFDVKIIASLINFDKNGKGYFMKKGSKYINENGIPVTRLDFRKPVKLYGKMKRFKGLYGEIEEFSPDMIFIHGCQFLDINVVVKYLKLNKNVTVYVDNHADFSNSATNFLSKNILHKFFWKICAKKIEPYTKKFYGVLPARVDFLKNVYELPPEKCELLVMGADDELVEKSIKENQRKVIRDKFGIADDDFLVMTGGKIDLFKKQTLMLMDSVAKIENPKVKLLVFGSVVPELKEQFNSLLSDRVIYAGWITSSDSYNFFPASDLVVFPGRHSVFWEQVVGQGVPMLVKEWQGTTHVDIGGNVEFLHNDSTDKIKEKIEEIVGNKEKYEKMKKIACEEGMKHFSYKEISKRAIDLK